MQHEQFNVDYWKNIFPMETIRQRNKSILRGDYVTSPVDLLGILYTRERLTIFKEANHIPTDVFVYGFGDPKILSTTKVGGVPFRPVNRAWPEHDGRSMTFLAQFNFSDSSDLLDFQLPGNLLLVFYIDFPNIERETTYHYEWYDWERIKHIFKRDQVPKNGFLQANFSGKPASWYCARYRTVDYPHAHDMLPRNDMQWIDYARSYRVLNQKYGWQEVLCNHNLSNIEVIEGTKIGGSIPYFYAMTKGVQVPDIVTKCRYLCSLSSIQPRASYDIDGSLSYPFLNRKKALIYDHPDSAYDNHSLVILDAGFFHFFFSNEGKVLCEWST